MAPYVESWDDAGPAAPIARNALRGQCVSRDHDHVRHGTASLLAGIDLLTRIVVRDTREKTFPREFIGFVQKLDGARLTATAICPFSTIIWRICSEKQRFRWALLAWRPGLPHIRVAAKRGLRDSIKAPVQQHQPSTAIHSWIYRLDEAAYYQSILGTVLGAAKLTYSDGL